VNNDNANLLLAIAADHARLLRSNGQAVAALLIDEQARKIQADMAAEKKPEV
jgi:hypothetical protein